MSVLLESNTLVYDSSKGSGSAAASYGVSPVTAKFPELFEAGAMAFSYTVPVNKKAILRTVNLAFNPLYRTNAVTASGLNFGTLVLKVNASTVLELRVQNCSTFTISVNANEPDQVRSRFYSFGDGLVFNDTDVISVELTSPTIDPKKFMFTMFGQQSTTPVVQYTETVIQTTSATEVFTYTVSGSGFTLKGIKFAGQYWDALFQAVAQIYVSGQLVLEFPVKSSPEQVHAGTIRGIPLGNMVLYAGQRIDVCISDFARIGNRYTVTLAGELKAAGGGGSFTFVA